MDLIKDLHAISSRLNLLYIEDDEQLRVQMTGIFQELFNEVDTGENGIVGLNLYTNRLKQRQKPYDIVITDINMPEMNGIELIEAIYQTNPLQPIIVVSAHNESEYLLELLYLGIDSFLIKPVKHNALVSTLYKVTKSIENERLVNKHYKEIEELNTQLSFKSLELEKSNDELHSKNIALEKSMRIIEGMQYKDHLHRKISLPSNTLTVHTKKEKDDTKSNPLLFQIETIISTIALQYPNKKIEDTQLHDLSKALSTYLNSLPKDEDFLILRLCFSKLASALEQRPKCSSIQELERIIGILESFFFVYSKWEKEWKNIEKEDFKMFCISIDNEVSTLIDVWNCKI
ncbi:MAG: hypothetical protein COA44_01665 [Arcobacter sp.]|nr:MAG: hypothetical protein COA44_01665 [Arcobacter sp.]